MAVADRQIVLRDGRIEADGPAELLWTRPPTAFVARFLGHRNVAPAEVRSHTLVTPWGALDGVPGVASAQDGPVTIVLRADAVRLDEAGPIRGTVATRRFRGDHFLLDVMVAGPTADSTPADPLEVEARGAPIPRVGDEVRVAIDPASALLLPGGATARP